MAKTEDGVEKFSSVVKQKPNYEYKPSIYCRCGEKTPRWISWTKKNPGLRFNKCKRSIEEGGCGYYRFVDDPFPNRANAIIRGLCESEKELAEENNNLVAENKELKARHMVFNGMVDELLSLKDENHYLTKRLNKLRFMLGIFSFVVGQVVFKRFNERKSFVNNFKDGLGPNIWKKINHNKDESGKLYVDSNGADGFEVHLDEDNSWVVSLEKSSCTCRMWDLTGIPCAHAMCVIVNYNLDVTSYVSKWYSREMFELAYKNPILPVQSKKFWPRVIVTSIRPPSFVKFPGRPRKIRRREGWEPAQCGTKLSHKGRKKSCTFCKLSFD